MFDKFELNKKNRSDVSGLVSYWFVLLMLPEPFFNMLGTEILRRYT